jgi:dipeptidyl aminopeptidase/acylaminoacyl peptidase
MSRFPALPLLRWIRRSSLLRCVAVFSLLAQPAGAGRHAWPLSGKGRIDGSNASPGAAAQGVDLEKPLVNIDEDISAFAFAPDGRIVYSVRRQFHTKQYDLERDDIWLQETNGKRRRLLQGEKLLHGTAPFSYTIDAFRWSPSGHLILAQLFTTSVVDEHGTTQDSTMTLGIEDGGKEIRLGNVDNLIKDAANAIWLTDSATIVYLNEIVKPKILYSFRYLNVTAGPGGPVFEGRTFLDASQVPKTNVAIAVERDRNLTGPPRLQRLELLAQDDHELATLDGYNGGISVSPGGGKVAYFIDREILEVRDLTNPNKVARLRVGLGAFQWSLDGTRILLKRAPEKKSGDLVWIEVPPLAPVAPDKDPPVAQPTPVSILHGLAFRDFAISPDGRQLAVIAPGKRNLLVLPLPR